MDLVGPVDDAHHPRAGKGESEAEVGRNSGRPMRLDRPVDRLVEHRRRGDLDQRKFAARGLVAVPVRFVGGVKAQEAGLLDHDAGVGDALTRHALVGEGLAEGRAGE